MFHSMNLALENESRYVQECIESTLSHRWGSLLIVLKPASGVHGSQYAVAVVNGTCALQVALQLAGVQRDDEVLVPTLSFVATANAVHYCGRFLILWIARKRR